MHKDKPGWVCTRKKAHSGPCATVFYKTEWEWYGPNSMGSLWYTDIEQLI